MITLTPELKAYLDEWRAEIHQSLTWLAEPQSPAPATTTPLVVTPAVYIDKSAAVPAPCVTSPVASSDTADLVLASAGLAEPAAQIPAIGEPGTVARGAQNTTSTMARATCSTDCAAQAIITSEGMALMPTCFNPEAPIAGVTTVALLQDGVSESMEEPGALHCSSSPTTTSLETQVPEVTAFMCFKPEKITSSTSVVTTMAQEGVTMAQDACSTYCPPQQPKAVPWLVTSSLPTPSEYSDQKLFMPSPSRRMTSRVHVHRPMPWPSFRDVRATGDETRPRPWPSFISYCGGGCQKQSGLPPQARYQSLVQQSSFWCTLASANRWYSLNHEVMISFSPEPISIGKYEACLISQWLLHGTAPNLLVYEFSEDDTLVVLFKEFLFRWSVVQYCSYFSLFTRACKSAMEFGIQRQIPFVSDKSLVTFSAFSDGPANAFAQRLQIPVQLNYQDQDTGLEGVCKLGVQIFTRPSVIYLLIDVSVSVFKLWHIPWFSLLFTEWTSEDQYDLALLQWKIAWQLDGEYFDVSTAVQFSVVDVQYLLTGTTCLFVLTELWVTGFISQYSQWHSVSSLLCCTGADLLSASGRSSSDNMKMDGNEALIIRFCQVLLLALLGPAYYLSSGGRCEAHRVPNSWMFSQEGTYIKVGHLNYSVINHIIPEAYRCPGEDNGLARASHISWEAWTVDGLEFSTDCGQAPFQGGRRNIRSILSDQVLVSCYYYLDHECYFDTGANYKDNSIKTREVHMPWDPGKVSQQFSSEASAWGQAEFQGGRDVRTLPGVHLDGPVQGDELGPATHGHLQNTKRSNGRGIRLDQNTAAAASSPTFGSNSPPPFHACSSV